MGWSNTSGGLPSWVDTSTPNVFAVTGSITATSTITGNGINASGGTGRFASDRHLLNSVGGKASFNDRNDDIDFFVKSVSGTMIQVDAATDALAFFDATPVTQPTVTGAKGGNAALASLMTALSNLGIVVDSTS